MKIRNREINIFSMSALDLFASGMGAFILLAVISLPFFGNTSKVIVPEVKQCPIPKPCPVCPPVAPPGLKKMPALDLVIVLDVTGSMTDSLSGLKAEIDEIAILISRLAESASIRVIAFGDENFDRPVTQYPLTSVNNISQLKSNLNNLKINIGMGSGGNDSDGEAVYAGFLEAMNTKWRAGAKRKVVLVITDDYPHDGEDTMLINSVNDFVSADPNHQVSVRYLKKDKKELRYYKDMAKRGKGTYSDSSSGSLTAALLLALLPK